jgi:hemoglobin-like flavoprotein
MRTKATPILTPRQKRLVRESLESIEEYSNAVTKLFYGRLFEVAPEVRGLFKISLEEQSQKLLDMLGTIVDALDRMQELQPQLVELGRKHVTYGVKPEHYDVMRTALLWAFARALEYEFDAETKSAWNDMLCAIASVMLEGKAETTL